MSELPINWVETTLSEIGKWGSGGTPKATNEKYYGGTIPWAKIGDLNDGIVLKTEDCITEEGLLNSSAKLVEIDTLLVAMYGSIGKLGIAGVRLATNQAIAFCKIYEKLIIKELAFYYLRQRREHLLSIGQGGTQQNISQTILKAYPILLPPLNEQRRIVAKLDRLFARSRCAREELGRVSGLVQRYKQAILAAACSGRLTTDWRNEKNIEHYIQCTIANENIPIPVSWTIHTFQDLFKLIDGDRGSNYPKKEDYANQGHCVFLSTKNVREYGFLFEEVVFISKEKHLSLRGGLLEKQDVVITTRGTLGNVALFDENVPYEVVRINSGMLILRKINSNILEKFVILNIKSYFFTKQLQEKSSGSAQPQIPANTLKAFIFPLPPLEEQKEIVQRVEKLFKAIDLIEQEHQKASKLLDRLEQATLSKAFRGELVLQDPNDEPAAVLLERIQSDRQAQPKGKAIKSKQSHR